ncbi:GDNF family receptor alpha-like [Dunckerocampus dactyliophorus]|uniref:GDNF family receptor alpha-like n=1 Tax=Dunckerocampus dactyliophorus TaxID=161453 RepID=UPI0024059F8D|nr:GDNF family receptor alpha-like [Dunckerocampus dactyliophorus]
MRFKQSWCLATMQRIDVGVAVMLGFLLADVCSLASSTRSDCVIHMDTCIAHVCKNQEALVRIICESKGCQITDPEVCNVTIQAVFDQFPQLRECVCALEEGLCSAIQELVTQCKPKPAAPQMRSTRTDWQSSTLIHFDDDAVGYCTDQMRLCVSDAVCNKYLARVLQACMAGQCDPDRCGRETQHFYASMPHNIAEMLVMCECDPSDHSCLQMKATLHGSTCSDDTWICQESVRHCVEDQPCRELLTSFQVKCWSPEEASCDEALQSECFSRMNPSVILGGDLDCRKAFVATVGTALHHPCTCKQVRGPDLLTCSMIHDVLHNRSHFRSHWRTSNGPSHPPAISASGKGHRGLTDYFLYSCAAALLLGILLMPLAVLYKIRVLRRDKRRDETGFQPLDKGHCVALL